MAKEFGYRITRSYPSPPAAVFDALADVPSWKRWSRPVIVSSKWESGGDPRVGGVGAVRSAGFPPLLIRERITGFEPGRLLSYTYVGRIIPVRNYNAIVTLAENASGGTDLSWSATFGRVIPLSGRVVSLVVRLPVLFMAWRLKPESARRAAGRAA